MEERSNVVVDVSRFFLIEVTGDSSEVNSSVAEDYWADDDAQSCSCDTSDIQSVRHFGTVDVDDDDDDDDRLASSCSNGQQDKGVESEDEDEDEDEVNQSQKRRLGVVRNNGKQQKESSKGGSVELVSEKDRDRLFWEACLAS